MDRKVFSFVAAAAAVVAFAAASPAALVSLDFNTTGSDTATGDVGVFTGQTGDWNVLALGAASASNKTTSPSISDMTAGDGSATTIDFTLNTTNLNWRATSIDGTDDLREDVAFLRAETAGGFWWLIEGLTPNAAYDIAFYGQFQGGNFVNPGRWTIDGDAKDNLDGSNNVTGQVVFLNVTADGTGVIGGTGSGAFNRISTFTFSSWSGLQVRNAVVIPTPAALPAGLGLLALLTIRRRRG